MKKNNIKARIIGTALAAVCAVSSLAAVSAVGASAAVIDNSISVSAQASNKECRMTVNGKNWTYWIQDNVNISIKGQLDFSNGTCTFIIKGLTPGVSNTVLKTLRDDGKWNNIPVRFTVDGNLNVTGQQTGRAFVTNTKYEG